MMISKTIDGIFTATRYGVWAMGALGMILSVVLAVVNLSMGLPSVLTMVAAFLVSVAVTLALMPAKFAKEDSQKRRITMAVIAAVAATAIMGIVYFTNGGFPALNLLFIKL